MFYMSVTRVGDCFKECPSKGKTFFLGNLSELSNMCRISVGPYDAPNPIGVRVS